MHDGDRAAPVALARDAPVAQAPGRAFTAEPAALQLLDHPPLGRLDVKAIEEARIVEGALAYIGLLGDGEGRRVGTWRQDNRQHRQAILASVFEIALIAGGAAEDGAGAIVHQDEVGDMERQPQVGQERMPARVPVS